jgi:predicted Rossmann fold nucleotide-binding protein DprA/Smf involved in DNA uptake
MSGPTRSAFTTRLRADIRARLDVLESEAEALRRALTILDGTPKRLHTPRAATRKPEDPTQAILRALADGPGARASVIALSEGRQPEEIKKTLDELEAAGRVERDGLGWRLAPRDVDVSMRG